MDPKELLALARMIDGVVSGLSAAQHHGWQIAQPPRLPEITVGRNRSRVTRAGVKLRRADLPTSWCSGHVLTPTAAVLDCARRLPVAESLAVADSALRSELVTTASLEAALTRIPRTGRSRATRAINLADGRAMSAFESVTRAIGLQVAGLNLVPQGNIDAIGHGDLADHRLRIVVECDSWRHHSAPEVFRRDVRRYTAMTLAGWIVVRVIWEDAIHHPERVRKQLEDAVALARWRLA